MKRLILIILVFCLCSCEKIITMRASSNIEYNFNIIDNVIAIKKNKYEFIDAPLIKKIDERFLLINNEKPVIEMKFFINDSLFYIMYFFNNINSQVSVCVSPINLSDPYNSWQSYMEGKNTIFYTVSSDTIDDIKSNFYLVYLEEAYFYKNIRQIDSGSILKIQTKYKLNGELVKEEKIIDKKLYELDSLKLGDYISTICASYFSLPIDIDKVKQEINSSKIENLFKIYIGDTQQFLPVFYLDDLKYENTNLYLKDIGCVTMDSPFRNGSKEILYRRNNSDNTYSGIRIYPLKNKIVLFTRLAEGGGYEFYRKNKFTCEYCSDGQNMQYQLFMKKK